ncbi:MAG: hypothetical protein IJ176_07035 [Prevotella sp.]|nr:hypothetical protein [Prevotella sp.]
MQSYEVIPKYTTFFQTLTHPKKAEELFSSRENIFPSHENLFSSLENKFPSLENSFVDFAVTLSPIPPHDSCAAISNYFFAVFFTPVRFIPLIFCTFVAHK